MLEKAKDQEIKTKTKAANEKVKNAKVKAALAKNKPHPQQPAGLDPEQLSAVVVNAVIEGMHKIKEIENMNDDNSPAKKVADSMISDAKK